MKCYHTVDGPLFQTPWKKLGDLISGSKVLLLHKLLFGTFQVSSMYLHFKWLEYRGSSKGILITGGWNRGTPLYTVVSSYQVVIIERFHGI